MEYSIMEMISLTNWHLLILSFNSVDEYSNLNLNCVRGCMWDIRASKYLYLILIHYLKSISLCLFFVSLTEDICQYIYTIHIMLVGLFWFFNCILCYSASLHHSNWNLRTAKYNISNKVERPLLTWSRMCFIS
jgi:hypothetical protein